MKNRVKLDRNGKVIERRVWTIQDEAIHRGNNYAEKHAKANQDLARYKEATVHAILKNAYQEGFLHGFEHKFDNTNYEEK
jgi:hypothetical protein